MTYIGEGILTEYDIQNLQTTFDFISGSSNLEPEWGSYNQGQHRTYEAVDGGKPQSHGQHGQWVNKVKQ